MFLFIGYVLLIILLIAMIFTVWQYFLYKKLYTVRSPNSKEKRQQLKRDRDLRFFLYLRILIVAFVVSILVTTFFGIKALISSNQLELATAKVNVLEKEIRDLKTMAGKSTNQQSNKEQQEPSSISIEEYRDQAWQISTFPWSELVKTDEEKGSETGEKTEYETQLAEKLKPFVGDCMVTISQNHSEPSVSVFVMSLGLSTDAFQTAQENVQAMIEDLNPVKEVTVIQFSFSYGDNGNSQKKLFMYYRDGAELKEVKK